MLVVNIGCKITKKNPNSTMLAPVNGIIYVFAVATGGLNAIAGVLKNKHLVHVYVWLWQW